MENVPIEGSHKEPIYESGEGPITNPARNTKSQQVYQSAESFGGNSKPNTKFGNRQQIKEDFLEDQDED